MTEPDFGEQFDTTDAVRVEFPSSVSLARDYLQAKEARKKRMDDERKLKGPQRNRFRKRPNPGEDYSPGKYSPRYTPTAAGDGGGRGGGGGGGDA